MNWKKINISNKEREKLYHNLRTKAYIILKNKHKKEFTKIMKSLMNKHYKIYERIK